MNKPAYVLGSLAAYGYPAEPTTVRVRRLVWEGTGKAARLVIPVDGTVDTIPAGDVAWERTTTRPGEARLVLKTGGPALLWYAS